MERAIDHNMTGQQRMVILDGLIFLGIEAIFQTTKFIEPHLISLICWSIRNRRRKISNAEKRVQVSLLMNSLLTGDINYKLRCFVEFKPDRYIPMGLLRQFCTALEGYEYLPKEEQEKAERAVWCTSGENLHGALVTVKDSLEMAIEFRNLIVSEYYNLCRQEAARLKRKSVIRISEEDLTHNLIHGVVIAIDKYNSDNGALTSYIRPWMRYLSQSPKQGHELGLAYDIPHNHKQKISKLGYSNIGSDLEESTEGESTDTVVELIQQNQAVERLISVVREADPLGIYRLSLGIDETMTEDHKRQMLRQSMLNSSTYTQ